MVFPFGGGHVYQLYNTFTFKVSTLYCCLLLYDIYIYRISSVFLLHMYSIVFVDVHIMLYIDFLYRTLTTASVVYMRVCVGLWT